MTTAPRTAAEETEFTLAKAVVLFRVAGLTEIALVAGFDTRNYRDHAETAAVLLAAIVAESAALCIACLRIRRVRARWALTDLAFTIGVLAAGAVVTSSPQGRLYFAYPYSVICSIAFGIALHHVRTVLAATTALAAGYVYAGGHLHGDPAANVALNAVTYFPNTLVALAISQQLRRMGRDLDASRVREASLARDQERVRHARMLHDRVLQTLETLARGPWIADDGFQARVAEEAAWLRSLVEGSSESTEGDLLGQLHQIVARNARNGLHVEFNYTTLHASEIVRLRALDPRRIDAVTGAVQEALTNVAKHAGVSSAVLRIGTTPRALLISVLDQGAGFDPANHRAGMGLNGCITGRITDVGGSVQIDATPGCGTYIEITLPLSAPATMTCSNVTADTDT